MNSVTADVLYQMYIVDGKTMKAISEELHIAVGKIHRLIHEYGIPAKKLSDYPATDKQRAAWSKIGKSKKGVSLTQEHRKKISEAKKIHAAGHIKIRSDGYKSLYYPDYPHANIDGYVMEHVYIMEQHIGRLLEDNECVHHINFDRADNRIDNLRLMTKSEHMSYHSKLRWQNKKGSDDLSIQ